MASWVTRTGNTFIQWGWQIKNDVDIRISFPAAFSSIPAVVVTSEWSNAGVGYVDTIYNVTTTGFNVHSGNRAPNYYVDWHAIGLAPSLAAASAPLAGDMEAAVAAFKQLDRGREVALTKDSYDKGDEPSAGKDPGHP